MTSMYEPASSTVTCSARLSPPTHWKTPLACELFINVTTGSGASLCGTVKLARFTGANRPSFVSSDSTLRLNSRVGPAFSPIATAPSEFFAVPALFAPPEFAFADEDPRPPPMTNGPLRRPLSRFEFDAALEFAEEFVFAAEFVLPMRMMLRFEFDAAGEPPPRRIAGRLELPCKVGFGVGVGVGVGAGVGLAAGRPSRMTGRLVLVCCAASLACTRPSGV